MDPDFQERMFARQIAVMKGQAWNVVETLKTSDHGPLELTRRAKVCVWDDLVDVPIAIPMRATSSEIRRRSGSEFAKGIEEEMDIGAANPSTSAPVEDLIGLSSPSAGDLPHPGRFEMSNPASPNGETPAVGNPAITAVANGEALGTSQSPPASPEDGVIKGTRPPLSRTFISHGNPPRSLNMYSPERSRDHQRRFSFATAAGRRNSNSIAAQLHGSGGGRYSHEFPDDNDELDGDLGYAAAEGMEGNHRKVIVERLEPVKSKNPVFTWC